MNWIIENLKEKKREAEAEFMSRTLINYSAIESEKLQDTNHILEQIKDLNEAISILKSSGMSKTPSST